LAQKNNTGDAMLIVINLGCLAREMQAAVVEHRAWFVTFVTAISRTSAATSSGNDR
jgi:hypothetical protein